MKFIIAISAIFALIACTRALKDGKFENSVFYAHICGQPPKANGDGLIECATYIPSWIYDASRNECLLFVYNGCEGNDNRFGTMEECEQKCRE
ncbi:male accessory gland serine protease inhibitor-like isoform X1 [Rhagoletis pomonella]|uniref:male accessory gland serine protease inhibitor-like isoform X1 n=1 Tax=Rhagoletis pomonella TaxID=28610 RepID=UPI001780691B|nr:male accessory gland serine protease inhibitor-like isoform X1 [Rhagoletis pomonella]